MVLYSDDPSQMYKQLHALHRAAEGRGRKRKLQCHNFVNNADAVPRFLGSSLDAVHQAVENYAPSMSVRSWSLGGHTYVPAVGTLKKSLFASFCCLHLPRTLCVHGHTWVDLSGRAVWSPTYLHGLSGFPWKPPVPIAHHPSHCSAACFSNMSSCRQLPLHHMAMSYQA